MENYLRFILSAGSSRTFNCCAISNGLVAPQPSDSKAVATLDAAKEPPKLLFESRALNFVIVIKEPARTEPGMFSAAPGKTLRTRLYFPYNRERPHEGGVSIDARNPKVDEALLEVAGLDRKNRPQGYDHDKKILHILDELPSLDPFLMKDRFRQAEMTVPDQYLFIMPEEWEAIRLFVHNQFRVVAHVIFPADTGQMDEKAEQLTQQLWDLRDLDHLGALTKVFGLDPSRTEEIFYSWKGVIYYDYEFQRLQSQLEALHTWFDQGSMPKDFCKPIVEKELDRSRTAIKNMLASAAVETEKHLGLYHKSFDLFFKEKKTAANFVAFLQSAPKNFYSLGESISKLSHAVVIWDRATQNFHRRMLPSESLLELFGFMQDIF